MGDAGLFGPGSVIWKVNREGVLLLGGGRALILQVAHPLVAAGVAEHSDYREHPWARLYRTLDVVYRIVFGTTEEAEELALRLRNLHTRVIGVTRESAGRYPAGTRYEASDPELAMWVHATLVDTAMQVYRRYVGPLTELETRRYYEDQMLLGERFGVPRETQPQTLPEFEQYLAAMVDSDRIAVSETLRDVVDATLRPPLHPVARPLVEAVNLATVGMLPPRLREELGLPWGANRRRLDRASRAVLRRALPLLPGMLRDMPPARSAERRVAAAA
jgi:uncharacterized protein (DUF2236 family)